MRRLFDEEEDRGKETKRVGEAWKCVSGCF